MQRNGLDVSCSDGDASEDPDDRTSRSVPCPDCSGLSFPNLSKFNWHRKCVHEKPYECQAQGCCKRFAQQQALDRHTQAKHEDTDNPAKFYHCTVDGCKYASTGDKRKKFLRHDQVKEHIKEKGHYGPHSACDRARRPGVPLYAEYIITAFFEEWTLDESEDSKPRRTVQSCEFKSWKNKTKLWHLDDTDENKVLRKRDDSASTDDGLKCTVIGCYYALPPPQGCKIVLFKTERALQEHRRRAHEAAGLDFALTTHLREPERPSSTSALGLTDLMNYSMGVVSIDSNMLQGVDFEPMFGAHHMEREYCHRSEVVIECYCQSCLQANTTPRESSYNPCMSTATPHAATSEIGFPKLFTSTTYDTYDPLSECSFDERFTFGSTSNSTTSLVRQDSLKLRGRLKCTIPLCTSTFRRKGDLQRHLETVHSSVAYSCHFCEKRFRRKDKLTGHLRYRHPDTYSDTTKRRSVLSDSTNFSAYSAFSSSGQQSGRDVVPSDTLVTARSSSLAWTPESTNMFQETPPARSFEQQTSWLGLGGWQTASPSSMQTGINDSSICIEEPSPDLIGGI